MRAFHVCAATLERELAIEPAPETRALYEALGGVGAAAPSPRFVGRGAEYGRLMAIWRSAAAGTAQFVVVRGEPGIGKTRLVEELRAQATTVAVEGRAYAAEGPIAYGLATTWLRSEPVAGRLERLDGAQRTELARLLPELAGRPSEPLPEPELRRRLFAAIARALLAAGAPLLLIADDAHWADAQSLGLIHYLLRAAPDARLLVAATVRPEDLDAAHPLRAVVAELQARGRCTEIALGRLDRRQTALLAEAMTGTPLDESAGERLYESTEGNPLFVVEALRPDAPAEASRVQSVIAGRLARLSPPAAELAGLAASIGRAFTADVLAAVAELDERTFVGALDELWRRGLIRAHGASAYDFTHGRIRDAAYEALGPPRRRHAHLAIARALERSGSAPPAALALHYEQAGATADAVRWHARAAEAAQWLHAHADAVRALERALALSERLPAGPNTATLQLRLLSALPAPLLTLEGYGAERMTSVHVRATALAEQLGAQLGSPLVWSLAMAALVRGDWTSARDLGQQLRARAADEDDQVLLVESDYLQGIAAYWPGRLDEARGHFEAALRRFRPERRRAHVLRYGQDPELLVRLRLAHTLWLLGDDEQADHERDVALAVAEGSSHAYSRAVAWVWACILAIERGDTARLREHARALTAPALDDAAAQIRLAAEAFSGYLDVLEGRSAGIARVRATREAVVHGDSPAPGLPGVITRMLLELYAVTDQPQDGLALSDQALVMGRGAELWEAEIRRLRAEFLAALGAPADEVEAERRRALAVAQRQGARTFASRVQGTLAERPPQHDAAADVLPKETA